MTLDARSMAVGLFEARTAGEQFRPVAGLASGDLNQAYNVQDELFSLISPEQAGWKIALTNAGARAAFDVPEPIYARLGKGGMTANAAVLQANQFMHPGIEMELAVRIARPFPPESSPMGDLGDYIDVVAAAYEIIDDRNADYSAIDAASLVADLCWNRGFVLGPSCPFDQLGKVADLECVLEIDGRQVAVESGLAGDNPLEAVIGLVAHLRKRGRRIEAGEWVMTGSLLPPVFCEAGQKFDFRIGTLPSAEMCIV